MGIGMASGDHRAIEAAQNAVSSQLLETSINGATRVLVNVTSGNDLTLAEFTEAADQIAQLCDQQDANIIFGWVPDPSLEGEVRVTVLATGFAPRDEAAERRLAAQRPISPPVQPGDAYRRNLPDEVARADEPQAATQAEPGPTVATPTPTPATPPAPEPRKPNPDDLDIPAFLRRR
jgi:cell division protein FtsZ